MQCWGFNLDFQLGIGLDPDYWETSPQTVVGFP
jgi:hypothetical protein